MNLLRRLISLLIISIVFTVPVSAAVGVDIDGYCDVVAADDDKGDGKKKGDKKDGESEEEPDCE
jgi:hypothetical protein